MGGSAAQSVMLMAIVVVLTVIQFRYVEEESAVLIPWSPRLPSRGRRPHSLAHLEACVVHLRTGPSSILKLGVIIVRPSRCIWRDHRRPASTHTAQDIVQAPRPLVPGSNFLGELQRALFGSGPAPTPRGTRMMWVSFVRHRHHPGQDRHLAAVGVCHRVTSAFPSRCICFWADLHRD